MNFEPEILYEDEVVVVINKPAGLTVHSDGRRAELTLADWLIGRWPALLEVGEPALLSDGREIARPGIVHRLDRDTSGVMIIAKTQESFLFLKNQFKNRQVKKIYRALVHGNFADTTSEKVIDLPIGRSKKDPRRRVASPKAASTLRPAETGYRVLETFPAYSYIEAKPRTGRTHQIRVHFKAIQHPIVGDGLYAPGQPVPAGLKRQALHAYSLALKLPGGGEKRFEAPLPADMATTLDNLRQAC